MKEGNSLRRNENIDNPQSAVEPSLEAKREPSVSTRIQNPLIPPAQGCSDGPGWWRLLGSSPESRGFSVAGDLGSFSAKLTAMLVPILLIVLILVLIADYSNPLDSNLEESPVAAGFVAETSLETEKETPDAEPEELAAPEIPQMSEASAEPENAVDVVAGDVVADEVAGEDDATEAPVVAEEPMEEVASEAPVKTNEKPKQVTIEGILYSRDNPSAIIGGRIVHVGDVISDALVVEIRKDRVLFERTGQQWGRGVQETLATQ